jgi:hypothetical protein
MCPQLQAKNGAVKKRWAVLLGEQIVLLGELKDTKIIIL